MRGGWLIIMMLVSLLSFGGDSSSGEDVKVFAAEGIVIYQADLQPTLEAMKSVLTNQEPLSEGSLKNIVLGLWKVKKMAAEAREQGLDKNPAVIRQLDTARDAVLANALYEKARKATMDWNQKDLEEEARDYYDAHTQEYRSEERIAASHILFKFTCDCVKCDCIAERNEKAEQAKKVLALLKERKEDFFNIAREYSEDENTARRGGALGAAFPREKLQAEFANAAFAMQPGEISEIVTTSYGFHIIRLDRKFEQRIYPFEDVKLIIIDKLSMRKMKEKMTDFENKYAQESALGQWNDPYIQGLLGKASEEQKRRLLEQKDKIHIVPGASVTTPAPIKMELDEKRSAIQK